MWIGPPCEHRKYVSGEGTPGMEVKVKGFSVLPHAPQGAAVRKGTKLRSFNIL